MGKPVLIKTGASAADDAIAIEVANNCQQCNTWYLGSTAGAMDVYVSANGTTYQSAAIALTDLSSLTPATRLAATVAGGNYMFEGRWKGVKLQQVGATAVVGAFLIGADD